MRSKWAAGLATIFCATLFAHEHHASHKGTLVECGEEFAHLELVLEKNGKLTGYMLDGEAENAQRVKQKEIEIKITSIDGKAQALTVTLKAVANVLTGESEGDTSEFAATVLALKDASKFEGSIGALNVKGADFKDVKFKFPEGNEEGKDEKKK